MPTDGRRFRMAQLFVPREREKLVNSIIYFTRETKHCHTLKLFKLLNFADLEHSAKPAEPSRVFGLSSSTERAGPNGVVGRT